MSTERSVTPSAGWIDVLSMIDRGTLLVLGAQDAGKSSLCRWLVGQLDRGLERVALVDCDPGQTTVGVPGCLGLAMTGPWEAPAALWFVGATSPPGNLLPLVVGAARLAHQARNRGAQVVILDGCGLVDGALARVLHLHLAHGAGVDHLIALERDGELESLLRLLTQDGRRVDRLKVSGVARTRDREERRRHREERFAAHFSDARTRLVSPRRVFGRDWAPGAGEDLEEGTVLGLLDAEGFCLGLGIFRAAHADRVEILTPVTDVPVARVQAGDFRLDDEGHELS